MDREKLRREAVRQLRRMASGAPVEELRITQREDGSPELELAGVYGGEMCTVELDLAWEPDGEGSGRSHPEKTPELFPLDGSFDASLLQKVPSRLCVQVNWTGTPVQKDLDTVLHTLKRVLEANGLLVTYYDVMLVPMYSLEEYNNHEAIQNGLLESGPVPADDIA